MSQREPGQPKPGGGIVLRGEASRCGPGPDTPLWNALVRALRPHLRQRGSKAQLARLLGLHRQRLHECLKAGSASLDAERTLLLLGWLGYFQQGGVLTPSVRAGRRRPNAKEPAAPGNL